MKPTFRLISQGLNAPVGGLDHPGCEAQRMTDMKALSYPFEKWS